MADDADEVKVFRSADIDELDPQSSHQLAEDKKDVVLEAELESRPPENLVGSKSGAFSKPQPSPAFSALGFPQMAAFSPSFNAMMSNPWLMMGTAAYMRPPMSPSMCFMPQAAALSPSFMQLQHLMVGPGSPLYGAMAGVKLEPGLNPLAAAARGNPLNQVMNQMRMPYNNGQSAMSNNNMQEPNMLKRTRDGKIKKEDHIKKPLNAFMWFMKENRPKMIEELGFKEKQSAELNKELGKRWHELGKEEQQKYFDLAKKDREAHKEKYPQWSARENYAVHKRKKRRRDKADDGVDSKKCRARFGVGNEHMWCKFCRRKKRCEYSYANSEGGMSSDLQDRVSASGSSGPSPLTSSMGGPSPIGTTTNSLDHNASDSESDGDEAEVEDGVEEDNDVTLSHQALQEVANQQQMLAL
ncbi:unnamed protein product [Auanema sp. JU1783]|nr:unnamed protein product [Auanema sp. JU1783]